MDSAIPISLFALLQDQLGAKLQPLRCTKATLVHISHALEDLVLAERLPAILFTGFQESSHWREETTRYRALADIAQQVCIFAGGTLPPESRASELHVTLGEGDPLRQEWFLTILCPQFAVVLCGQDRQVAADEEATRQFDTLWSFAPAIIDQVLDQMEQVVAVYRPDRLAALRAARQRYPLMSPDPDLVTRFTAELIRFEEELHQRLIAASTRLQQQMRWREDLLATLVHDFRSPLQAITFALDLLGAPDSLQDRDIGTVLDIGASGARQLQDLIQMILDTSQLAEGELRLNIERIDLPSWVEETVAPHRALAAHGQVQLKVDVGAPQLWADPLLLRRALDNLLGNALKFTPPGGQVQLSIAPAPQAGHLEVRVHDTGRGISSEDLPFIFERYRQGRHKERRGYGLGLYFCRLVASAHGGSIMVSSEIEKGTAFTLVLPSAEPAPGALAAPPPPGAASDKG